MKKWTGSSSVPAAFALFPEDISQPPREWLSDSSMCNVGPRCLAAGISRLWKSRNCSRRISAPGSGPFEMRTEKLTASRQIDLGFWMPTRNRSRIVLLLPTVTKRGQFLVPASLLLTLVGLPSVMTF